MRSPRLLLAVALVGACARTTLPDQPVIPAKLFLQRDLQLPSGLRVVVQEDHSTPLVVVSAVYGTGATGDPAGQGGLAHLLEHLTYRARLSGTRVSDWLKGAGAIFNAVTSADTTLYYSYAQRSALPDLMQIEVWRLLHPLEGVTADEVQVERQVVLNERREWQNAGLGPDLLNDVQALLYPAGHPLARTVLGTDESLAATTLAGLRAFARQHYQPQNCTLVVAGDVRIDEVARLMNEWPREAVVSPGEPRKHREPLARVEAVEPPPVVSTAPRFVKGAVSEPRLVLAWSLPGLSRDNRALLNVVGGAIRAIARGAAGARTLTAINGSLVLVDVPLDAKTSREEQRERLLDTITSERAVTIARGVTHQSRFERASAVIRATADPVSSAVGLATHVASSGRTSFYKDTVEELLAVDPDRVSAFLRRYIARDRAVTLFVSPDPDAASEAEPALAAASDEQHQLGRAASPNLAAMTGKDILRVVHAPGVGALPRFRMPSGLEVVTVTRPDTPIARIQLHLPGGEATLRPAGFSTLIEPLSIAPCAARHRPLRVLGGELGFHWGMDHTALAVVVPDGNLANGLASLEDEVACRELQPRGAPVLSARLDAWEKGGSTPRRQAAAAFTAALYPGHPYAFAPDVAALRKLGKGTVDEALDRHFRPDGATLVVMSSRPPAEVRPLVEELLGDWKPAGHPAPAPAPPPPAPAHRVVQTFAAPGGGQVQLRIGCRLPALTADNLPVTDVLAEVLREQTAELRESWGATYGLHTTVTSLPGSTHLSIEGAVDASRAAAGLSRLLALLAEDASAGPDQRTFITARWDVARRFNSLAATGESLVSLVMFAARLGLPPEAWDAYPVRLANTARSEVRDLMKSCAGHEVVTLLGDTGALSAQLAARGLR
jgi:zinc protease